VCEFLSSLHILGRSSELTKCDPSVYNVLESVSALTFLQVEKACAEFQRNYFKTYFFSKISRIYVYVPVNTLKHKVQVTTALKLPTVLTIKAYNSP